MITRALEWVGDTDGFLELIDQRRLPREFVKLQCRDVKQLYEAIKTLAVRGAPAIGVASAYGPVLALQKLTSTSDPQHALQTVTDSCDYLASARPTAINLFWALERIRQKAHQAAKQTGTGVKTLHEAVLAEANAICRQDVDMCRRIGRNGEQFIKDGSGVLTHCNAGALATAGQGTALSLMFEAHKKGKRFTVYADETRPLLQGARLTAWELQQADIDVVVVCDNMAGWLMKRRMVDAVITGADRIAANGDAANKIGTYSLSILAREHGIPFYIAAPSSTFDLNIESGDAIPIEERSASEVIGFANVQVAPDGVRVYNPAFDVTRARDITAIITERGVIKKPDTQRIRECLKPSQ